MRWVTRTEPKNATIRIKNRFLILPKSIKGETRWLEFARYKQVYNSNWGNYEDWQCLKWEDVEWLN